MNRSARAELQNWPPSNWNLSRRTARAWFATWGSHPPPTQHTQHQMKYSKMISNAPAHVPTTVRMNGEPIARSISSPNRKRWPKEKPLIIIGGGCAAGATELNRLIASLRRLISISLQCDLVWRAQKAVCLLAGALGQPARRRSLCLYIWPAGSLYHHHHQHHYHYHARLRSGPSERLRGGSAIWPPKMRTNSSIADCK